VGNLGAFVVYQGGHYVSRADVDKQMLLLGSLALWIVLSAAVHIYLAKTGRATVPIIAGLMAAALGVAGIVQLVLSLRTPDSITVGDTYYVVSRSYFVTNTAISYLVVAGVALVTWKLARGWVKLLLAPSFWVYHIGTGTVILSNLLLRLYAPRRYADYAEAMYLPSMMSSQGAQLIFFGLVVMVVLAVVAIVQSISRRQST
jgi:hypothetical protein